MSVSQAPYPRDEIDFKGLLRRTVQVPVVAVAILAAAQLWGIQFQRNSSQWVDHTDQVIGMSQELLKLIIDMETGVRGFLEYGDAEFLRPYNEAKSVIDSRFDSLNQLITDNPAQQARLAAIRNLFDQWRTVAERAVELRRSGYEAALERNHMMDSLRAEHVAFVATEDRLRGERVQSTQKITGRLIAACALLSLGTGVLLTVFTRRHVRLLGARFQELVDTTEERAELLREKAELIDLAHDTIIMLGLDGTIRFWNHGAEEMYRYSKEQAVGKVAHEMLQTIFPKPPAEIEAEVLRDGRWEGDLIHTTQDGARIDVASRWVLQRDKQGRACGVMEINNNISERKLAEKALRENEELFRALVMASSDVVYRMSADWNEMRFLRGHDFIADTDAPRNNWLQEYIPPDDQREVLAAIEQAIRTKTIFELEHRVLRVDSSLGWTFSRAIPLKSANGEILEWIGAASDITERKQTEEVLRSQSDQLRALAVRLQGVREEERAKVARDLHDQIGQILAAIKMNITWTGKHLSEAEEELRDRLDESIELINEGAQSVRNICSGLRPGILDDLGLAAAVEWQANEFTSRTGIECRVLTPSDEFQLDRDRATAMFRIFQESLTNVIRHAEARSVRVSLYQEDEHLLLAIEDDGKGFEQSGISGSLGLLGMKERAGACGGHLEISSSPGNGTTVTVRVPIGHIGVEGEQQ